MVKIASANLLKFWPLTFWPLAFVTFLKFCQWKWGSIRRLHSKFHQNQSKMTSNCNIHVLALAFY